MLRAVPRDDRNRARNDVVGLVCDEAAAPLVDRARAGSHQRPGKLYRRVGRGDLDDDHGNRHRPQRTTSTSMGRRRNTGQRCRTTDGEHGCPPTLRTVKDAAGEPDVSEATQPATPAVVDGLESKCVSRVRYELWPLSRRPQGAEPPYPGARHQAVAGVHRRSRRTRRPPGGLAPDDFW